MFVETRILALLAPEIVLLLGATAVYVGGSFARDRRNLGLVALMLYIAAFVLTLSAPSSAETIFSGPVAVGSLTLLMRLVMLSLGVAFTLSLAWQADSNLIGEHLGSVMLMVLGGMLAASANELTLLFVAFELISIPTYVLIFLSRRDRAAGEAAMKYFFLSIFSSAILLYGLSFLYGLGGTTLIQGFGDLPGLRERLSEAAAAKESALGALAPLAPLALVLVLAGLGFKLAAAPFQFYAPDVYQGASNTAAGLLATAPKVAGVIGLVKLAYLALPTVSDYAWQTAVVMSIVTMTLGNVCALWQKNVRRLLAYSSIAHGGYLLLGFAAATAAGSHENAAGGLSSLVLYVTLYAFASAGSFIALAALGAERREVNSLDDLAGLGKREPLLAAALAVFMFSLAGIPPLAGFWGKFALFNGALALGTDPQTGAAGRWLLVLAIAGALNAAIGAAYYLRTIGVMFFQAGPAENNDAPATSHLGGNIAAGACAAVVLLAGFFPGPLLELSSKVERQNQARVAVQASPEAVAAAGSLVRP